MEWEEIENRIARSHVIYFTLLLVSLSGSNANIINYPRDNSKLCSCGGDRQVFYWDVASGRVIRKFRGHDGEV